jgi:predicted nucleic acid-binding protein
MRYVLDANVAVKWVIAEADSANALQLRDDFRNAVHELLAPDFFPLEVLHALTRAERQGRILPAQGGHFWRDVMQTCPVLFPSIPLGARAYAISSSARIGIYDCLYVALAEREGCEMVTADDKLLRNLQGPFPFLVALSSLPAPPAGPAVP